MSMTKSAVDLKVADEVWIILALLHRDHPGRSDFSIEEIMQRAQQEMLTKALRPGFYVHVSQHCVANRPPNPGRYRMLVETAPSRRRLFRQGDSYNPEREGGKTTPAREGMPQQFESLLDWYWRWSEQAGKDARQHDPLLRLRGSGQGLWKDEPADQYVQRLRESWQ